MFPFLRRLAFYLLLACVLAGCSTPRKRSRQHAAAFRRLSADDQRLVLRGKVRPGLSQEGVYIAWGEPDEKGHTPLSSKDAPATETWIYRQRVTLLEPINSYDYFGPYHGYGFWPVDPWLRPGYGAGGAGNEGVLQYQPHVRSLDTLRIAEFSQGSVDRYKTAGGTWVLPEKPAVAVVTVVSGPAAPKKTVRAHHVRSKQVPVKRDKSRVQDAKRRKAAFKRHPERGEAKAAHHPAHKGTKTTVGKKQHSV